MEVVMLQPLTERYKADLLGVLSCFDRIVITGTLPGACFAQGMTSYLYSRHILINDYQRHLRRFRAAHPETIWCRRCHCFKHFSHHRH
jgi:hypothetical protein